MGWYIKKDLSLGLSAPNCARYFLKILSINICDALRALVPSVRIKNLKNTHGGLLLLVKLQASALLKVTFLHGYFLRFAKRTNGTKSRKVSHIY